MKSILLILSFVLILVSANNHAFALEEDPVDGNCGLHECLQDAVDLYEEEEISAGELSDSIAGCQTDYLLCTFM